MHNDGTFQIQPVLAELFFSYVPLFQNHILVIDFSSVSEFKDIDDDFLINNVADYPPVSNTVPP